MHWFGVLPLFPFTFSDSTLSLFDISHLFGCYFLSRRPMLFGTSVSSSPVSFFPNVYREKHSIRCSSSWRSDHFQHHSSVLSKGQVQKAAFKGKSRKCSLLKRFTPVVPILYNSFWNPSAPASGNLRDDFCLHIKAFQLAHALPGPRQTGSPHTSQGCDLLPCALSHS